MVSWQIVDDDLDRRFRIRSNIERPLRRTSTHRPIEDRFLNKNTIYRLLPALVVLLIVASSSQAAFRTTVTKSKHFKMADLKKVAIVTTQCHDEIDCANLERRVIGELRKIKKVTFKQVPESDLREFLFAKGSVAYTPELRDAIVEEFGIDAFIEIKVPFAEKGDGFGGIVSSKVKVELTITKPGGAILLYGVGVGRPNNVVSSPERVVGNVVEDIIEEAFK